MDQAEMYEGRPIMMLQQPINVEKDSLQLSVQLKSKHCGQRVVDSLAHFLALTNRLDGC